MMRALVLLWLCVAQGQAAYMVCLRTSTRTALNSISMGLIKKQERNEDQGSGGLLIDKMKADAAAAVGGGSLFPSDDLGSPDISAYKKRMAKATKAADEQSAEAKEKSSQDD